MGKTIFFLSIFLFILFVGIIKKEGVIINLALAEDPEPEPGPAPEPEPTPEPPPPDGSVDVPTPGQEIDPTLKPDSAETPEVQNEPMPEGLMIVRIKDITLSKWSITCNAKQNKSSSSSTASFSGGNMRTAGYSPRIIATDADK